MTNDPQQISEPPQLEAKDVEETHTFWLETAKSMVQGSFTAIDELARQVLTVSGLLIGLYANALALGSLKGAMTDFWATLVYGSPLIFLFITLLFTLSVFFPNKKEFNLHSSEASRLVFNQLLKSKLRRARLGSICLLLSVLALLIAGFVYMIG
jgi:hypothetical protein